MILCHIANRGGACFNSCTPEGRGRGREELSECEANLANQGQIVSETLSQGKKKRSYTLLRTYLGRSHTYHILQESLTSMLWCILVRRKPQQIWKSFGGLSYNLQVIDKFTALYMMCSNPYCKHFEGLVELAELQAFCQSHILENPQVCFGLLLSSCFCLLVYYTFKKLQSGSPIQYFSHLINLDNQNSVQIEFE